MSASFESQKPQQPQQQTVTGGKTRRGFLQTAVVAGAGALAARVAVAQESGAKPAAAAAPAEKPLNPAASGNASKVRLGAIGVGGKGWSGIQGLEKAGAEVVALCDIDEKTLDKGKKEWAGASTHVDFRKMLEERGEDIDAVIVSTPDHTHAVAAMMAMKMGKHCYCEKPLTYSIDEARQLTEAARKYKVATQMGNQGHATEFNRRVVEWVKGGVVGKIKEVHVWTDRPGSPLRMVWPQGMQERPAPSTQPTPSHVHWDLWLGPAPERPFVEGVYHPFKWRGWWDFGTGSLGDMGCHLMDPAYWALDLKDPVSLSAESEGGSQESGPIKSKVVYEFPERNGRPALTMTWYDGSNQPSRELINNYFLPPDYNGSIYVGEHGTILAGYLTVPVLVDPKGKLETVIPGESIPRSPGHHKEFIIACQGGPAAGSNFDYAGPLTETVLLGNLAIRAGKKLDWDAKNMRVTNDESANQWVKREYRKGWSL